MLLKTTLATALAIMTSAAQVQAKFVFAHYMVGNAANSAKEDWLDDMTKAHDVGIDAFALNMGAGDTHTQNALNLAVQAANAHGNFSLFLSFDYAAWGVWDAGVVTNLINSFATQAGKAQFRYNNKPFVSTFEGVANAADWAAIKKNTGCFFVPDWSSTGPAKIPQDNIDGAFSWNAWPDGNTNKDTRADQDWKSAMSGKTYMMGVSPWFYTSLPQYTKNWILRGDDLWSTRWNQVLQIQPDFVEIITWNDYGESHYIGPIRSPGIVANANRYVDKNPHDHWRDLLPQYIAAYKNSQPMGPQDEKIVVYHRPNPTSAGRDGGTNSGIPGAQIVVPAAQVSQDEVFVDVLLHSPATVAVTIGGAEVGSKQAGSGITHFSAPFSGKTGPVVVNVNRGSTVLSSSGTTISATTPDGLVNWNAVVGGSQKL